MLKRLLFWLLPEVHIGDMQNPMPVVERYHPIGSIKHAHYPQEGFYSVCGYRDDSEPGPNGARVAIFGKMVLPTSFGYPDDACRGSILCSIINKQRTLKRGVTGHWEVA
jgi:hypothetical protein